MADVNIAYTADAQQTCTLASLTSSGTFIAGREAVFVDNSTTKFVDILLSGFVTTGTTPTVNTNILVYVFAPVNDTPTWPDQMDGTNAPRSITSALMGGGFLKLAAVMTVSATSDLTYDFGPVSVAQLFGGVCPQKFGIWVTHNTVAALNATGGNHEITVQGIEYTVA